MLAYTAIISPFQVAFLDENVVLDAMDIFQAVPRSMTGN
jgi:hypothetical protein